MPTMSRITAFSLVTLLVFAVLPGAVQLDAQEPAALPTAATADEEGTTTPPRQGRRRPRVDDSNTGYIDNAIVGSQLRLRYDSAFAADHPDRAEFIYGKCLCFTAAAGQDAASPGPAADLDYQELELTYEHAFHDRFSLFVEVPFRSLDLTQPDGFVNSVPTPGAPGSRLDNSGLGDVRAGMKYALVADRGRYLTLQVRSYFASGDAAKNLGTDHDSIEPGLLYLSQPTKRWTMGAEARWWHPLGGSSDPLTGASNPDSPVGRIEPPDPAVRNDDFAGDVLRFGIGASYEGRGARLSVTPVAELVGWYVLDGYATPPIALGDAGPGTYVVEADGDTIVNLKLGARIRGRGPGSFYLGYGFPLTSDDWYDGILRVGYRVGLSSPKQRREQEAAAQAAADHAAAERAVEAAAAQRAEADLAVREAETRRADVEAATVLDRRDEWSLIRRGNRHKGWMVSRGQEPPAR